LKEIPLGFKCCKLGTAGSFDVQLSWSSCFASTLSLEDLFFDRRDSAPGRFDSVRGAPTCFTEVAGIGEEPLLGGMGGLEEECRRWCELEVNDAIVGVPGLEGMGVPLPQLRATRRSDVLNINPPSLEKNERWTREVRGRSRVSSAVKQVESRMTQDRASSGGKSDALPRRSPLFRTMPMPPYAHAGDGQHNSQANSAVATTSTIGLNTSTELRLKTWLPI
jgi:hypothetical protein